MNKFTQTFRQQHLELLYQKSKEDYCYNAYKKISLLSCIITLIRLITFVNQEVTIGILIASAILLMIVLMSILILKFCVFGSVYCLLLINHLLILLELYDDIGTNEFVLGSNLAIIHTTILLVIDYKLAIVNISLQSALKLLIAGLFDSKTDACQIIMSVLCPLCFFSIVNTIEKQRRMLFLSHSQGNDWHRLLPSVISDPFIMFTYDEERTCFKFRNSCSIDKFPHSNIELNPEQNFRQFIRMTQIGHLTLEQYILNQISKQTSFFELNQLSLRTNSIDSPEGEEIKILLAELYHIEDNFIIVLEQTKKKAIALQSTKEYLITLINQHQDLVYGFLAKQSSLITKSILDEKKRLQYLYQVKLHHLYFQGKYKISNSFSLAHYQQELMTFNFRSLFMSIATLFQQAYPNWNFSIEFADSNFTVKQDKEQIMDFFIQLLQVTMRKTQPDILQVTRIVLHATEQLLFIRVMCINQYILADNLNKNLLIKQYLTTHSPESDIKVTQNGICIQLYKDVEELQQFAKFENSYY